jgi:hypothetical protein
MGSARKVLSYAGFTWIKTGWVCSPARPGNAHATVTGVHSVLASAGELPLQQPYNDVADTVDKFMNLGKLPSRSSRTPRKRSGRRR